MLLAFTEYAALTHRPTLHLKRNYSKHALWAALDRTEQYSQPTASLLPAPRPADPICAFDTVFFAPDI